MNDTLQVPGKLRRKLVSVAETMSKRGYICSNDWEFPLCFYRKGGDRDATEKNRMASKLKLRAHQIEHIELTAQTEDEVLTLISQIVEHGDFVDPMQERLEAMVSAKTNQQDATIAQLMQQNNVLQGQLAELLARIGPAKVAAPAAKPAPAKGGKAKPEPEVVEAGESGSA